MRQQLTAICKRYDGLSRRERIIVATAGSVAILLCWYAVFAEPAINQRSRLAAEATALQQQLSGLQQELAQLGTDQPDEVQQQLDRVKQRSSDVQSRIDEYAAELISPTEMARLLEKVLQRQRSLQLVRLRNHGAEDLLPQDMPGDQRLYRHRFEMELTGPYLECLAYIEDLERLPWRLYWQQVVIDADEFPDNRILIEVATLSLHEEWIGV